MDNDEYRYLSALEPWQGEGSIDPEELDALRLRAWREQGILTVSVTDERLTAWEKIGICRIAKRFYGPVGDDSSAS